MNLKRFVPSICFVASALVPLLVPSLALAQDMFVTPFETVLEWIQAVGAIIIVIGLCMLGFQMMKGEGGSLGKAAGWIIGGVIVMSAPEIRDALMP